MNRKEMMMRRKDRRAKRSLNLIELTFEQLARTLAQQRAERKNGEREAVLLVLLLLLPLSIAQGTLTLSLTHAQQ